MPNSTATDAAHNAWMQLLLRKVPFSAPESLWVGLFLTVPALDGSSGTEVSASGNNYGRVAVVGGANSGWTGPSGVDLEYANAYDLTFPPPTGVWGEITGAGLFSAATGGVLYYTAVLGRSKLVRAGDAPPRIMASQLRISRAWG